MRGALRDPTLQYEIEQFLFEEAELLDSGDFSAWLDLFTDDCHYWMPVRETTADLKDSTRGEDELAIFDDDKPFLMARVDRLVKTPMAHAEQPRSRTRRLITNVRIVGAEDEFVTVAANILVYQSRLERTESMFVGRRIDVLRRNGRGWLISKRKIILDQTMLPRTLSIFF
ncbi:MAG TPA: aromatic-ring-hydroxylating dioxygenase subunit beta [Rhodoblastus sp.]|mgnify:CR=1 FL=1|nr:aromatic-ring-hydroxylating dioxygenase subunit beta [Rhodoblastus sp.]